MGTVFHFARLTSAFFLVLSAASAQSFVISTFAGGPPGALAPVAALAASIGQPEPVAADASGNLYVSSSANYIFKVDRKGVLTRVAGNGHGGFAGDGGTAAQSGLKFGAADIYGYAGGYLALDRAGNLYVADPGNGRIRRIAPDGAISTIAGDGVWGDRGDGGPAVDAHLGTVSGIAVDSAGDVYIADQGRRNRIRVISTGGNINTLPASTSLNLQGMAGLATDSQGNLYVADYAGNRVIEISPAGAGSCTDFPSNSMNLCWRLRSNRGAAVASSGIWC
ncbi:MAG: hypothetical protein ACLQU1_36265 [Bryobacteraceae bacterium]